MIELTAQALIEFASRMGAATFNVTGGISPLWHFVRSNGEHGVVMPDAFEDGDHKDLVAEALRKMFEEMDVIAYVFMCESWLRLAGPDEIDLEAVRREGLGADPKRQECIWYTAEDATGSLSAYQMIERPEGPNGPGRLQPLKWMKRSSRSEGRFVGMLPVKGLMH
jgi:hypothetical protein